MNWNILQILCINHTGLKKKINVFKQRDILGPSSFASETEDISVLPASGVAFRGRRPALSSRTYSSFTPYFNKKLLYFCCVSWSCDWASVGM